jgi:hypothetical protein
MNIFVAPPGIAALQIEGAENVFRRTDNLAKKLTFSAYRMGGIKQQGYF